MPLIYIELPFYRELLENTKFMSGLRIYSNTQFSKNEGIRNFNELSNVNKLSTTELSLAVHYPKIIIIIVRMLIGIQIILECCTLRVLVMQKQLEREVCTHKIKKPEQIVSKSLLSKSLAKTLCVIVIQLQLIYVHIWSYIHVSVYTVMFLCMYTCFGYVCVKSFPVGKILQVKSCR